MEQRCASWLAQLNQLKVVVAKENMGLYRDDDLGIEKKKKELVKIFKNNGLSITVKTNIKTADFLDIHFDLVKEFYHINHIKMMTLCTLTKNLIIHHQYCSNFRNQSQKEFQKFHEINIFLTNQFFVTKMP